MIKINHTSRLIFTLLALATTSVFLPAEASGQSKLESYLRNADLDSDGKIEPHEMTGPIKRYLLRKGYDINERQKIRDVVKASEKKPSAEPVASNLKVPKFGVEPAEGTGVGSFSAAVETVKYSEAATKKARELFENYDRNGNGILDEGEIARMSWGSPRPSANDTNGDGRLTFVEIQGRYHDREMAEQRSQGSSQDSERSSREERGGDVRRNRGRLGREGSTRDTSTSRDDSSSDRESTSSAFSSTELDKRDRSRIYVEKYFADRDKDKNGILEGDELSKVKSQSRYDTNKDGKIEQDEMLEVILPSTSGGPSSASKSSSSKSRRTATTSSRSRSKTSGAFTKVDTNADRLIQMHEFSETWTQKQLDEFLAKDKDGDGVISPTEW